MGVQSAYLDESSSFDELTFVTLKNFELRLANCLIKDFQCLGETNVGKSSCFFDFLVMINDEMECCFFQQSSLLVQVGSEKVVSRSVKINVVGEFKLTLVEEALQVVLVRSREKVNSDIFGVHVISVDKPGIKVLIKQYRVAELV